MQEPTHWKALQYENLKCSFQYGFPILDLKMLPFQIRLVSTELQLI